MRGAIVVALLAGCSLRPVVRLPGHEMTIAPNPVLEAHCEHIDNDVIAFTTMAVGLGAAGSATGLGALFTSSTSRYATGATSAITTIGSAVFSTLSNLYSSRYTRECTAGTTGVSTP